MQNGHDIIIQALTEKIEWLQAENAKLKTPPIEKALSRILGISPESIVNFDPENTSVFNRYSLVAMENLGEMKANILALKDKNERLEKWDKEHRERIEELAIELNVSNNLIQSLQFQNENFRKINQNFKRTLEDLPQWKNSVKDGMPVLKVGEHLIYNYLNESVRHYYHRFIADREDYIFLPVGGDYEYIIIPQNNAIN